MAFSRWLTLLTWLPAAHSIATSVGRAASCRDRRNQANVRTPFFSASNPEVAKLRDGMTAAVWLRFLFNSGKRQVQPFTINYRLDVTFVQVFGGDHGGWLFGGAAAPTVRDVTASWEWHHYAFTYNASRQEVQYYIDGAAHGPPQTTELTSLPIDDDMKLSLCSLCGTYDYKLPADYTSCVSAYAMSGEMDDLAIWGRALRAEELASAWNSSLTARATAGLEPDLVFLYNFNNLSAAEAGVVPNMGSAGAEYDMMLGQSSSKQLDEHRYKYKDESLSYAVLDAAPPLLMPAGDSPHKPVDPGAPIVAVVAAGETAALRAPDGTAFSLTAPAAPFVSTERHLVTVNGHEVPVELQPVMPPRVPTLPIVLTVQTIEDGEIAVPLRATTEDGLPSHGEITALPATGTLYAIASGEDASNRAHPITSVGSRINATRAGFWVAYVPPADSSGRNLATFSYRFRVDAYPSVVSDAATIVIDVYPVDDLPAVQPAGRTFAEDSEPLGVPINLTYFDLEPGTPVAAVVSKLPTKGKLYVADDASGGLREIGAPYNVFDVGVPVAQYLSKLVRVSSFWGKPPYAGYHPLGLLGPPDSHTYGEGFNDAPWVFDTAVDPPIGQRVLHPGSNGLVAYVRAVNASGQTLMIEYAKMYKRDQLNALRQCHIPTSSDRNYPADCLFDLVPAAGVVTAVVPRGTISGMDAAVWCPLFKNYVGDVDISGAPNDIAFGAEYAWTHNQAQVYDGTPISYTEFFEAQVAEPVYVLQIEIGCPRGMGMVTSIQVRDGDEWVSLYREQPLVGVAEEHQLTKQYWSWSPRICRTHFKTNFLRIEVDTSQQTGIEDWNYIDYVRVIGSRSLQAAALPANVTSLLYVADAHASGQDSFEYRGTDCPGDSFRLSQPALVSIDMPPVNDAPRIDADEATSRTLTFRLGSSRNNVSFPSFDVDSTALTLKLTRLPAYGRFISGGLHLGALISSSASYVFEFDEADASAAARHAGLVADDGSGRRDPRSHAGGVGFGALVNSSGDGSAWVTTTVEFSATDPQNASSLLTLVLRVPICLPGYGAYYVLDTNSYQDLHITRSLPPSTPQCTPCPAGTASSSAGSSACASCARGHFQAAQGQQQCEPCSPGSSGPSEGLAECAPCPIGSASAAFGAEVCPSCARGTVQPAAGQEECAPCPAGWFAPHEGMASCERCEFPWSALPQSAACDVCASGLYLSSTDVCRNCPRGASCAANTTLQTLVLKRGYWRLTHDSSSISPCHGTDADNPDVTDSPCLGGFGLGRCKEGHSGPLCENCGAGYYLSGAECKACPEVGSTIGIVFGAVFAAFLMLSAALLLAKRSARMQPALEWLQQVRATLDGFGALAKLKISIAFFQIYVAIPQVYSIDVPSEYSDAMKVFSWVNLDLFAMYPTTCISGAVHHTINISTWVTFSVPCVFLCLGVCSVLAQHALGLRPAAHGGAAYRTGGVTRALREGVLQGVPLALFWVFILVVPASRRLFMAWDCRPYESDDTSRERVWFLVQDTDVRCEMGGTQSAEHRSLTTLATGYLFIWPIGVPALFLAITVAQRKALREHRRTDWTAATAMIHREYKPAAFYWESFELLRRLLLSGFLLLIPRSLGVLQLIIAIVVCLLSFAAIFVVAPYKRADDNMLAVTANILLIMTFLTSVFIRLYSDMAAEGGKALAERVLGYSSCARGRLQPAPASVPRDRAAAGALVWALVPRHQNEAHTTPRCHRTFEISMIMLAFCFSFLALIVGSLLRIARNEVRRRRKTQAAEDAKLIDNAVHGTMRLYHPAVFLTLQQLMELGRFTSHEELRDAGGLRFVDTYDGLRDFAQRHVTAFLSHEWLGVGSPDPHGVQWAAAVRACNSLREREGIPASEFYIWLDFSSVPQSSGLLMQLAIDSLDKYASACKYFVVLAPTASHEAGRECSHDSYSLRGWCRLEQFARMTTGVRHMYVATDAADLRELTSMNLNEAVCVFEGNFTVASDRKKLVSVMLGLWAVVVNATMESTDSQMGELRRIIEADMQRIFPQSEFHDLVSKVRKLIEDDVTQSLSGKGPRILERHLTTVMKAVRIDSLAEVSSTDALYT